MSVKSLQVSRFLDTCAAFALNVQFKSINILIYSLLNSFKSSPSTKLCNRYFRHSSLSKLSLISLPHAFTDTLDYKKLPSSPSYIPLSPCPSLSSLVPPSICLSPTYPVRVPFLLFLPLLMSPVPATFHIPFHWLEYWRNFWLEYWRNYWLDYWLEYLLTPECWLESIT